MRELKFRAWDIRLKKMLYNVSPLILIGNEQWYIPSEWNSSEHENDIPYQDKIKMFVEGRRGILEQYTDLKDKNGVEIYEGDLIKFDSNKYGLMIVEFKNDYVGGWVLTHPTTINHVSLGARSSYDIEVIGNIHENPELLINKKE